MIFSTIFAQDLVLPGTDGKPVTITGPVTGFTNIGSIITKAIPYLFFFAGVTLLLMLVFGGFSLLTSGGDPKSLDSGKKRITNAIIGFIIIFVAYWLVQLVARIFGLTEFITIFG